MGAQNALDHHRTLTSGQMPPQNRARDMHSATTESNHHNDLFSL